MRIVADATHAAQNAGSARILKRLHALRPCVFAVVITPVLVMSGVVMPITAASIVP
jgi:hypothetical protein